MNRVFLLPFAELWFIFSPYHHLCPFTTRFKLNLNKTMNLKHHKRTLVYGSVPESQLP
uniref:Uncharacterized protein n=1 Tax=Medicago truncatula TaxID=3880 RepID=Q2HRK5_MEDTR|nr:hypothetical protein MtrDRAFT_AC158501g5v2 [Medicago truncatula]